jgi:hypothetical protein
MKKDPPKESRPERILLVITHHQGDCRGKAIRFTDRSEYQFRSLRELGSWLTTETALDTMREGGVAIRQELDSEDDTV